MPRKELAVDNVAEAYLALLAERRIEYLFANAGTDFAPLVEAFAKAARTGMPVPRPVLATHENLAFPMVHGYAIVSRRVPAVMVHVSVGTANGICDALNAARENVPILFTAGRSPLTESGLPGARDVYIHWAQEMFDQAGMLREIVKWDYELRNGQQLETVIDRALSIATTPPGGPVYLSLPREVLAAPRPECLVIHLGVDPLFSRYPIRGFPCDLAVTGAAASALPELGAALDRHVAASAVSERRRRVAEQREALVGGWQKTRESVA